MQDSEGFMWFCTDAGVSRFDGKTFERFTKRDGLSDNEIFRLFKDSKNRLWFLTYNGHLSYFKNNVFHNEGNTPLLRKMFLGESYTSAFEDKKGNIYFGTFGSKFIVLHNDSVVTYDFPVAYGSFSFFENRNGEVFVSSIASRKRIFNNSLLACPLKYKRLDVRYFESKLGNEFYVSDSGLVQIKAKGESVIVSNTILPTIESITCCFEGSDSSILFTTRSGVLLFQYINGHLNEKPEIILADKNILSVYEDDENNFWFCTQGDGVYMMSNTNRSYRNYTAADGLSNTDIKRIMKGPDTSLWLACSKGIVINIRKDTILNYNLTTLESNMNARVMDLVFDKRDYLWCATDRGILTLKDNAVSKRIPVSIGRIEGHPSTKSISCEENGRIIISHTFGIAELRHTGKSDDSYFEPMQEIEAEIRTFTHFLDNKNQLWVANINGLNLWDGKQMICYGDSDIILKSRILKIIEVGNTLVLSTNENGIIFFKDKKVYKTLTQKEGLPSDICRKIYYRNNKLLIGTNLGLAMVNYNNGQIGNIQVVNESEGIVSNDVQDVLDDGEYIYIATSNGLTTIKKTERVNQIKPPRVYISSVNINNKLENDIEALKSLDYSENTLIIKFIAITFQNPGKVLYQYKINSKTDGWVNTNNNTIEFSGVAPGKYIFNLRARKVNSTWSNLTTLEFIIKPPFWKTIWFYTIVFIISIIVLISLVRMYSKKRMQKHVAEISRRELILKERSRISSDMHDDLGADLSRIVVLSEVVKITEKLNQNTSTNIDKISQYAIDLRTKIDEIIWALNPRHDSLAALISYIHYYMRDYFEENNLKFNISLPSEIPALQVSAVFRRNIFLIVKEAVHNIVSHASATSVNIDIVLDGKMMNIKIEDNGQGFQVDGLSSGNGLVNMVKRAKDISGDLTISSSKGKGCVIKFKCNYNIPKESLAL